MRIININSNSNNDIKEQRRAFINIIVGGPIIGVDGLIDRYVHKLEFKKIVKNHIYGEEKDEDEKLSISALLMGAMTLNLNNNGLVSFVTHDDDENLSYIINDFVNYLMDTFSYIKIEEDDIDYEITPYNIAEKFFMVNVACCTSIPMDLCFPIPSPLEKYELIEMQKRLSSVADFDFILKNIVLKDDDCGYVLGCFIYLDPKI